MLDSPPVVYGNILITGGSNGEGSPSSGLYGDIRGWDAISGKLLWSFHTVPRAGEPGVETWEGESWKNRSGTNAWSYMTVDVERGLVFAPTGSPTSDFYGGDRKGKNLYGNSLIALDATTGTLKWFQQLVHHDIWDWDLPAAPILIDVRRNGRVVPAVAQITKMSTLFIFDRATGEPLFGLEERAVPQSDVPGEATWPTQPFPLKPPPLSRTSFDPARDFYYADARARGVLPGALERAQDVHEGHVHAAWSRGDDGDVSEHAWRGELERALVRSRARPRVFEHHESRSGGANGASNARRRRQRWSTSARRLGSGQSDASGISKPECRVRRRPLASSWLSM